MPRGTLAGDLTSGFPGLLDSYVNGTL
jgi:hypothetical protein